MFKTEKTEVSTKMVSSPFNIDVDTIPDDFHIEMIDMKNNTYLKNVFFSVHIEFFYKSSMNPEKSPF